MRYIWFPWMPLPEPTIPLLEWPHFVNFAASTSICVVILGTVVIIVRDRSRRDRKGLNTGSLAIARLVAVLPPLLAGWLAAGICEWSWPRFFGAVTSANTTLTWIGIWTGLWTAFAGTVALILVRRLDRFMASRVPIGAAGENSESVQIQRKESRPSSKPK